MITLAALPNWIVIFIVLAAVGPMMRMIFGDRDRSSRRRFKERYAGMLGERGLLPSADVERLESAIAERDTVIDDLQQRLNEMETRLDFAERLLARPKEDSTNQAPV